MPVKICGSLTLESAMTGETDLSVLEQKISTAVADCEIWRATGLTERYIEAYDLVEALQMQLRMRLRQPRVETQAA